MQEFIRLPNNTKKPLNTDFAVPKGFSYLFIFYAVRISPVRMA